MNTESGSLQNKYDELIEKFEELQKELLSVKIKNTSSELKVNEEFNRTLFELSPAAIFILDSSATIIDANPAYTKAIQYSYDELIGKKVYLVAPSVIDKPRIDQNIKDIIAGQQMDHIVQSKRKDGSLCDMHLIEKRILLPNGEYGVLSMAEDITESNHASLKLQQSEEQFRLLAENTNDVIWTMNPNGSFIFVSPSSIKLLGYTPDELKAQNWENILTPSSLKIANDYFIRLNNKNSDEYADGKPLTIELEQVRKDKTTVWTEIVLTKIMDDEGNLNFVLGVSRDINDRKKGEKALIESEWRYRTIIETTPDSVSILDRNYTIIYCNQRKADLFGYNDPDEIIGKNALDFIPEWEMTQFKKEVRFFLKKGIIKDKEIELLKKDGSVFTAEMNATILRFGPSVSNSLFVDFLKDITDRKKAQQALIESENRFKSIFLQNTAIMLLIDPLQNQKIEDANEAACRFYGYPREELLTMHMGQINILPDEERKKLMDKTLKHDSIIHRFKHKLADQSLCDVEVYASPIVLGNKKQLFIIVNDISERTRSEAEVEKRIRELSAIYQLSRKVNEAATVDHIYEYSLDTLEVTLQTNRSSILLFDEKNTMRFKAWRGISKKYRNAVEEHSPWDINTKDAKPICISNVFEDKSLARFWDLFKEENIFSLTFVPLTYNDRLMGKLVLYKDYECVINSKEMQLAETIANQIITAVMRRKDQEALQKSEKKYRNFFMDDLTGDFLSDLNGKIIECNPAFLKIFGLESLQDAQQKDISSLYQNKSDRTKLIDIVRKQKRVENYILNMRKVSGETLIIIENVIGVFDEQEKLVRLRGYLIDITQQKHAEEALIASEKSYRELFNNATDAIYIQDTNGFFLDVNETVEKMYGYEHSYFIGKTPAALSAPGMNDLEKLGKQIEKAVSGKPQQFEFWAVRKNGEIFPKEVRLNNSVYFGQKVIIAFARDITERKRAEISLRESEEKFRSIVHESIDGITLIDENSRIIEWNKAQEKITGLKRQDVINKTISELSNNFSQNHITETVNYLKKITMVLPENSAKAIHSNIYEETTIKDQEGIDHILQTVIFPVKSEKGFMTGSVSRDITELRRKELEHQKLQQQIQHAQKLESLGILAGGIAHDFNNLLTGILGNTGLAEMNVSETSPVIPNLKNIESSAMRAAELCRQLLAYSGRGRFVVKAVDLNEIVQEMTKLLETSISKKITIIYDFEKNLPAIEVDTAQIRQVIMNLILNASDAIENNVGRITLTTSSHYYDTEFLRKTYLNDNLESGNYVVLEVADTGHGMDKKTIARIFDPFFTTKFTGRGLGLAAVLGIIRGHHGAIEIDSEPGNGTTFKVYFPASLQQAVKSKDSDMQDKKWKASGTILVVDDEESIRMLCKRALEIHGFNVLCADDGRKAVELFNEQTDIKLVILDMTMPYMNGEETYKELQKIKADVKVLLSSGYSENEAFDKFTGKGIAGFLQKPYKASALTEKIKDLLK